MPSSKRSNSNDKTEEEDEDEEKDSKTGDDNSGAIAATFVFGALAGAVALFLIETYDANEKAKANAKRS